MMLEFTTAVNRMIDDGAQVEALLRNRWPGATLAVYDVHTLINDIHDNPTEYLDAPANVTGSYATCLEGQSCVYSNETKSSFLWYDELHPSERTDEIIARNFLDVVKYGNSSYAQYYTSADT
jgi:phospholipase/lecithinase/hemolysin